MTRRQLLESDGAPDAGLAQIAAGFTARAGGAAVTAGAGAMGHGASAPGPARPPVGPDDVWLLDMPPQVSTAAGTIDPVDWGPPTGWAWRITYVPFVFGAGCTQVTFYTQSGTGAVGLLFQANSSGLWEPGHLYLRNGSRLVAVTTGGGITISPRGEAVAIAYLPTYLA